MHIRKFDNFRMRTFETRLCSSKNALFQKMIKPEIAPKDRTEFNKNNKFLFFESQKNEENEGNDPLRKSGFPKQETWILLVGKLSKY